MAIPRDLRAPLGAVAISGAVLTLGALAFAGVHAAFSTGIGAAIATSNLWVLGRAVGASGTSAWRVVGLVKMLALFGGVWLLLTWRAIDPIPLVVGLGALPIGLTTGSMLSAGRARKAP